MAVKIVLRIAGIASAFLASVCIASTEPRAALPAGCQSALARASAEIAGKPLVAAFPPIQLQVRTPVAPVPLPSGGRQYLIYELHLQNFADSAMEIRAIEVLDADTAAATPVAMFKDADLNTVLRPVGSDAGTEQRRLGAGQSVIAFLCVAIDKHGPRALRHRVILERDFADGPTMIVRRTALPVLGRPLVGTDWSARNGPHAGSHHRMGIFVADGAATISRRYAVDWRKVRNGEQFAGDPLDPRSYFAYGEKVLAVADGTVAFARDGMPDNIPKTDAGFTLAMPLTMESIAGNVIVIDLGDGHLASYSHLQSDSVRVKTGDRVKRGQPIGRIGNSGDSRWPHLHFQVTPAIHPMHGEGDAFVIDKYRFKAPGKDWEMRSNEFPWGDTALIDFGPATEQKEKP